jgi:hypothetical protein
MYTNVNLAAPIGALAHLGIYKQTSFQIDLKSNQAAITDNGE